MTGDRTRPGPPAALPPLGALAVIQARAGELPPDAAEVMSEVGGPVLIVGDGAATAAATLNAGTPTAGPTTATPTAGPTAATPTAGPTAATPTRVWWCDTGPGLRPGALAGRLAPLLAAVPLLVLPGTADGRDLAPRLAAVLRRPLLTRAAWARATPSGVAAELCRLDGQILVPVEVDGPAVVTMEPGAGMLTASGPAAVTQVALPAPGHPPGPDVTVLEVLEPDPAAMELAEAPFVVSGGAGLAAGLDTATATAAFGLLGDVAAALGAAAGATRVATDAGWAAPDRQIGTTGVTIAPRLYVAFGISGAVQHTSGIGEPEHVVSVNLDPHCPMTAGSTLGIVADAHATLVALAGRLGVPVPGQVRDGG